MKKAKKIPWEVNMAMLYKCDGCKRIIEDKDEKVFAGYRWGGEHIFVPNAASRLFTF